MKLGVPRNPRYLSNLWKNGDAMPARAELLRNLPHRLCEPDLAKLVTALDLRTFGLPVPNDIVPFPLPWKDHAQFISAMFFDHEVARHAYLRLLMDTLPPLSEAAN